MNSENLALLGFLLSFFYNVPQIYKIYKKKSAESLSVISYLLCIFGQTCFAYRFWVIHEWPSFATTIVSIVSCIIVLIQYRIYRK